MGICELCNVAARVVVVVFDSYLLTTDEGNVFYDLEMEQDFSRANVKWFCKL